MRTYLKQFLRNFDFALFFTYVFLSLFGLVMIYSASLFWAVGEYGFAPDHFYRKHIINLMLAYPAFLLAAFFPYKNYKRKKILMFLVFAMLALLFAVHPFGYGREQLGAQSWIHLKIGSKSLGNIQPSEFAKLVFIIYFSSVFAKKAEAGTINNVNTAIYPPLIILVIAIISIMLETDIGSTGILAITAISVIIASGISKKTFFKLSMIFGGLLALGAVVIALRWESIMTGSRQGRILSYLNPFDYAQGSGFQIINSYIAIGSGGVQGHGLGNSVQKMGYLPEPHTDVIMAVISEELGVIGSIIVIGGLGFIVLRAMTIAIKAKDPHARMLAAGIGSMIGIQTFINLGGLTGLIPLTGVPLPFISYGGTSVIFISIAVGILMNVSMFVKYEKNK